MKARCIKKDSKNGLKTIQAPTNLCLTLAARRMAVKLKKAMFRPSISNVVEVLIHEKAMALGLNGKSQTGKAI